MAKKARKTDKNNHLLEEMGNLVTIESLFSTYILLDIFFSLELVSQAKSFSKQNKSRLVQEGLIQGYKLLLVATLDKYINDIVRTPETIGVEPDLDYRDYWAFTKGRGREITRTTPRADHHISKFVSKANSFIAEILSLGTWDDVEAFGIKTKSFRDCLRTISEKAYVANKGNKIIDMRAALLEASNMILWSTSGNPLPIAHMYTDYFISRKNDDPDIQSIDEMVRECHLSSGLTRFDFSQIDHTFVPRSLPAHWAIGYAYSLHESLKILAQNDTQKSRLLSLDKMVKDIKDWNDVRKYDGRMTSVYGLPKIYRGFNYKPLKPVTNDDRLPLMGEVEGVVSPERLLSIFGNRARIVERGFPGAFGSFECLLDGAIKRSKRTKEAAKVAIIVHKNRWGQEDYSTAIFLPAYGMMSNASMWWVYFLIGNNHSGSASHQWKLVFEKIKRNRKSIDLLVTHADEEEFYRYCEDPGYSRLNDAIILTNKITSDIRGVFPELLLSNMLTNTGYTKVLNRIRPKILKSVKGELDTIGLKYERNLLKKITMFESKGSATTDEELQLEINHFSENIDKIRQNLKSFCDELKISPSKDTEVEAIFVSMDSIKQKEGESELLDHFLFSRIHIEVPNKITLWDFDEFITQLKQDHVHQNYLDLLKKIPVAVVINPMRDRKSMLKPLIESQNKSNKQ